MKLPGSDSVRGATHQFREPSSLADPRARCIDPAGSQLWGQLCTAGGAVWPARARMPRGGGFSPTYQLCSPLCEPGFDSLVELAPRSARFSEPGHFAQEDVFNTGQFADFEDPASGFRGSHGWSPQNISAESAHLPEGCFFSFFLFFFLLSYYCAYGRLRRLSFNVTSWLALLQ